MNKSRVAVPSFLSLAISEERSSNSKEVSVKASEAKATDNTLNLGKKILLLSLLKFEQPKVVLKITIKTMAKKNPS